MRNIVLRISTSFILFGVLLAIPYTVSAQSSAFGTLTDEKTVGRDVLNIDGQNLAMYEKAIADYSKLFTAYTKSYGPQRTALEKQVLAKAKDAMTVKLGAVQTFLQTLKNKSIELNLMSDADKTFYDDGMNKYQSYANEKNKSVNNVSAITDLYAYSKDLNKEVLLGMQFSEVYLAKISVTRGRYLIEKLMLLAPIIQAQISTSSDVGGDVESIQRILDESMLTLENLKNDYSEIEKLATMGNISKDSESDFMARTRSANSKMVISYNGITDAVTKLRTLYAQAPWDEKLVEQLLEGPETQESTTSSEENK